MASVDDDILALANGWNHMAIGYRRLERGYWGLSILSATALALCIAITTVSLPLVFVMGLATGCLLGQATTMRRRRHEARSQRDRLQKLVLSLKEPS